MCASLYAMLITSNKMAPAWNALSVAQTARLFLTALCARADSTSTTDPPVFRIARTTTHSLSQEVRVSSAAANARPALRKSRITV